MDQNSIANIIKRMMGPSWAALAELQKVVNQLRDVVFNRPASVTEEIDRLPGRRHFFTYTQIQNFTADNSGSAGEAMQFKVSQDGPFVMTHYPMAMWRPNLPTTATNFGRWRPTASWPLPDQVIDGDIIDLSYQFADSGSQRNFQDGNVPAGLLSRPDAIIPLPCPTLFETDATIGFTPVYEDVNFDAGAATPTTGGTLVVILPGYRIITM